MANKRFEPVSYRPFRTQPLLAEGLLAVARDGGELESRVAAAMFRIADEAGAVADRQAERAGRMAGEQAGLAGAPSASVSGDIGGNVALSGDHRQMAAAILRKEEGFRDTPYWDTNAFRTGYGSDTITTADGKVVRVAKGMKISRADADRDLARRIPEFEKTIVGQVGADNWSRLPANARAALLSVGYNYGSLPGSVARAAKGGDAGALADAVAGLSANKKRRQREAEIIRSGPLPAGGGQVAGAPSVTVSGGGFRPSGRDTIYGRAFDEAGTKTYLSMLETEMRSTASQVYDRYRDDPATLEKAFGALKGELARDHVFPEILADYEAGFGRMAESYLEASRANYQKKLDDHAAAEFIERGSSLSTSLQKQLGDIDPASPGAADSLASSLQSVNRYYDDAVDRGVISAEAAAKAKVDRRNGLAAGFYARQAEGLDADGVAALRNTLWADFGKGQLAGIDGDGWADLEKKLVAVEKKAQAEQRKASGNIAARGTALAERIAAGYDADAGALTQLELDAAGAPNGEALAAAARKKIGAAEAVRDLAPSEARAYVDAMRERLGPNPTDEDIAAVTYAEKLVGDAEKEVATDPLGRAARMRKLELAPIDTSSAEALATSLAARRDQARQVAEMFDAPTMLYRAAEVKAIKADIASTDATRYAAAMSQLDFLASEGGGDELRKVFGERSFEALQDWQARLRYSSGAEIAAWLKDRADPKWQERMKPLLTKGETEARKVTFDEVVASLDDNMIFDASGPIDPDTKRLVMNDFVTLAAERYAITGDAETAREQTIERMRKVWGVTGVYGTRGGRLMPYPPEEHYAAVAGSTEWIGEELAAVAAERGFSIDAVALVADGKTKAAADRGEEPGYLLSHVDPDTGLEELVTDEAGRPLRHYFDLVAARRKALAQAEERRKIQNDPWLIWDEDTTIGPFYPPWRPASEEDLKMRADRIREITSGRRDAYEQRRRAHERYRALQQPTREKE